MITSDYYELFRFLADDYCLPQESILFVPDVAGWCRENGIDEPDSEKPVKLAMPYSDGCKVLIRRQVPEVVIEQRINALRIRNQINSVAVDVADRLDSDRKKLAFLFLGEYATTLPELRDNELLSDAWAFKEMERMGFFKT